MLNMKSKFSMNIMPAALVFAAATCLAWAEECVNPQEGLCDSPYPPTLEGHGKAEGASREKPRLFVLTDLANEPDDEESLVRLLAYANEFDIEGIAATPARRLFSPTAVRL